MGDPDCSNVTRFYDLLPENIMFDSALLMNKKVVGVPGLALAMDFDTTGYKDLVVTTRSINQVGGGGSLSQSAALFKNGTQSLLQSQVAAGGSVYLATARTADLTFAGDFWFEAWGYCLGQGNPVYTGGYNTLLSYGSFNATGGLWRWHLDSLKLALRVPSGTSDTAFFTSSIAVTNNSWNHFALGRSGSTTYLFVNGALGASSTAALGTVGFGVNLNIAGYNDSRLSGSTYAGFNGYIDRLRMYNTCLHTSAFTPSTGSYPN
jgi:hypothetical protein